MQRPFGSPCALRTRLALGGFVSAVLLFSTTAFAGDAVSALIRRQTDASSDAGQRGDQATVSSFLDDAVLFSAGDGAVQRDPKYDKTDAVSALLRRQTQAFRDARERGDRASTRPYLDASLLFVDEDGILSGRRDVAGGAAAASPRGGWSSVTVSDWVLHHSRDVAISSYTEDEVVRYGEQALDYKFLSVDTWVRRGAAWKMIGSETIPLHQDPSVAALPSNVLGDYVGLYSAGPGSVVTISQDGSALVSSSNGSMAAPLQAEFRDVFFTPGLPAGYARPRSIFQRDANGQLTGYVRSGIVYTKIGTTAPPAGSVAPATPPLGPLRLRDFVVRHRGDVAVATFLHDRDTPFYGQMVHQTYRSIETWIKRGVAWKMIASQGRQLLPDPPVASLAPKELEDYVGIYDAGSDRTVTIFRRGDELAASASGEPSVRLAAEVRDVFFTPGSPRTSIAFQRDASGHVRGYVWRRDERDLTFSKL